MDYKLIIARNLRVAIAQITKFNLDVFFKSPFMHSWVAIATGTEFAEVTQIVDQLYAEYKAKDLWERSRPRIGD